MQRSLPAAGRGERKVLHVVAGGSLPLVALALPAPALLAFLGSLAALALVVEGVRLAVPRANGLLVRWFGAFLKPDEVRRVTAATYLAVAALLCFLVFPREVAALALLFLAVGDPLAALVGQRVRRPRLWGKSLAGTATFVAAALVVGVGLALAGVTPRHPGVALGALVAALVELLPLPVDDNLTVPLAAGLAMALAGVGG